MPSPLKPSSTPAATTQVSQKITWPILELPPEHPIFGLPPGSTDAIQKWYVALQGAVTNHLNAVSNTIGNQAQQIQTLQSQLQSKTST